MVATLPRSLVILIIVCAWIPVWGQVARPVPEVGSLNPNLEGRIVDDAGAPVVNARIHLVSFGAGTGQTAFSDEDSRFFFYSIAPLRYQVQVSAPGYRDNTVSIDMTTGDQYVTIVLQPATKKEAASNALPAPESSSVELEDLKIPEEARQAFQRGVRALADSDLKAGEKHLKEALERHPEYPSALNALGLVYLEQKRPDKAFRSFQECLGLREDFAEANLGLAMILNDRKKFSEAERHLARIASSEVEDWRVFYETGRSFYGQQRFQEAERSLSRAKTLNAGYPNVYLLLANSFIRQDKLAAGLAELRRFLEIAPQSPLAEQVREKVKLLDEALQ